MKTVYPVSKPTIGTMERALVNDVLESGWLTHGEEVELFERAFSVRHAGAHCLAVSTGTAALHLALAALDLGPGDEVIVPNLTFVATANAVRYVGATPVLVDVDPVYHCLSPGAVASAITPLTKAIIPVHLYGQPANMHALMHLANQHGLVVVEDAAEGLGGFSGADAKPLGTIGHVGCFSFYGNKIITTGEGGMVVTRDQALRDRMFHLRGQAMTSQRYFHNEVGFNYRMPALSAAVGRAQIMALDENLAARKRICVDYAKFLSLWLSHKAWNGPDSWCLPMPSAPWLYTIRLPKHVSRERVQLRLADRGIETRPTFVPLNRLPMYAYGDHLFPNSIALGERGLSLPTYVGLTEDDVHNIVENVVAVVEELNHARV